MLSMDMIKKYSYDCNIRQFQDIEGYSHMKRGITDSGNVIIKELKFDCERLDFLELIYSEIENFKGVSSPIKNYEGENISRSNGCGVLVFKELKENDRFVPAKWWVEVLQRLHTIESFWQYKEIVISNHLQEVNALMSSAKKYMEQDIRYFVEKMLNKINWKLKKIGRVVLNHGDALNSNVMKNNDEFILIDFENAQIVPKEYDIQRKLWDEAIEIEEINETIDFYKDFKAAYEKFQKIDMGLLANLYIIDFCKTLCWLYIVSMDEKRDDCERQKIERNHFVDAVRKGKIEAVLNIIEKEVGEC